MIRQIPADEWPTGRNEPLLVLPFKPAELAEKFGLVFVEDHDDFEELDIAVVHSAAFGTVGLIRYKNVQFDGTVVYVDVDSDLETTRDAVLAEFELDLGDVEWINEGWPRESQADGR